VEAPLDEMIQEDGGLVALGDAAQHQRHPDQTLPLFQNQMGFLKQDKHDLTRQMNTAFKMNVITSKL
jgi:hypothetical protein